MVSPHHSPVGLMQLPPRRGRLSRRQPRPLRVLYSFPFRIGAGRICTTAWHQAAGAALAGAQVTVLAGSVERPLPATIRLETTLAAGPLRVPVRVLGRHGAARLHDWLTARWLQRHARQIDVVHGWPLASLTTIATAARLGIPFFLERPNAHTAYAYAAALEECQLLGLELPATHDHQFNRAFLAHEEKEYAAADFLLCPSDFVVQSFRERGVGLHKLLHHHYGFDPAQFVAGSQNASPDRGLAVLYAGVCEPRKGLHYALQAWLASGAQKRGRFRICGTFVPGYRQKLASLLTHPSVEVLGHCSNLPELMQQADLLVLPSVEEGSALVTYEARAAGCVLLVSDAAGAVCQHLDNALVHTRRDVEALTAHFRMLDQDRELLARLRRSSLATVGMLSWAAAGDKLAALYTYGAVLCGR